MNELRTEQGHIDATQFTMEDVVDLINVFRPHISVFMGSREDVLAHIAQQDTVFTKHPNVPGTEGYVNYQTSCELWDGNPACLNGPTIQLNLDRVGEDNQDRLI